MTLEQRLDRMERQNRFWRNLAIGTICLVALGAVIGAANDDKKPDAGGKELQVVEAKGFIVKNTDRKVVASLGVNKEGKQQTALILYAADGQANACMEVRSEQKEAVLSLGRGEPFEPRAFLATNGSDDPLHQGVNFVLGLPGPEGAMAQTWLSGKGATEKVVFNLSAEGNFTPDNKSSIVGIVTKDGPKWRIQGKSGDDIFTKP